MVNNRGCLEGKQCMRPGCIIVTMLFSENHQPIMKYRSLNLKAV